MNGQIVYCGKGSNARYRDYNSRGKDHLSEMKNNDLEYIILKYFNDEEKAYEYEEYLIKRLKSVNLCKYNISLGRRTSEETKIKLSEILKGKKRSNETKKRIKRNHPRSHAKKVLLYKEGVLLKEFRSARDAGRYAVLNGICSYGWCGRSLATGERTQATRDFPIGGFLFVYTSDKLELENTNEVIL